MARKILDLLVRLDGFGDRWGVWMQANPGVTIRAVNDPQERDYAPGWVRMHFSRGWGAQFAMACDMGKGFAARVAIPEGIEGPRYDMAGFVSYNVPRRGYFGPLGVSKLHRGKDIGTGLTLRALAEMELEGYGYAVIHHVGPVEFYRKVCGELIELPVYKR